MARYLLIESRDPFDSKDSEQFYGIARGLAERGNEVTLFMVQNGVLPVRRECSHAKTLAALGRSKVTLLADDFSLRERGIRSEELIPEAKPAGVDQMVEMLMTDGTKAIWH